jgi:hypothetical protein
VAASCSSCSLCRVQSGPGGVTASSIAASSGCGHENGAADRLLSSPKVFVSTDGRTICSLRSQLSYPSRGTPPQASWGNTAGFVLHGSGKQEGVELLAIAWTRGSLAEPVEHMCPMFAPGAAFPAAVGREQPGHRVGVEPQQAAAAAHRRQGAAAQIGIQPSHGSVQN